MKPIHKHVIDHDIYGHVPYERHSTGSGNPENPHENANHFAPVTAKKFQRKSG